MYSTKDIYMEYYISMWVMPNVRCWCTDLESQARRLIHVGNNLKCLVPCMYQA